MNPRWQPTTFPTPRHERAHDLLRRLVSDGAAHFFADACEIVQRRPPFRTTTHLVSHLIREVESATRQVLRTLPRAAAHLAESPPAKKKDSTHLAEIDAVLHALSLDANPVAIEWRTFVGDDGWHGTAHRDDLRSPRALDADFEARLELFVEVLSVVLDAAEGKYADVVAALEAVARAPKPSATDLKYVAVHLAPGVTALSHVFDKLSANWLVPLVERGVFEEPPEARHHDGGSVSFPSWPQAEYLRRIAAELPDAVAMTIESVPSVDNERIHVRFLEAAALMPSATAARVASHEARWLANRERWVSGLLPDAVAKLAVVLIDGGELDAALTLLRVALALAPPDGERRSQGPSARFSSWNYGQLVDEAIPALAAKAPDATFDLLHDLIARAATEAWSWRRRIDSSAHPGVDEPIDMLFAHLRDLYLARAAIAPAELRAAVGDLEAKGARIYTRLALHLLRVHGKAAPDLVLDRATDPDRLGAGDDDDDVTLMIHDRFADLAAPDQARVIAAMRETASIDRLRTEFGDRVSEDRLPEISRHRLLKWLHAIGDARPASEAAEYAALVGDLGVPRPPDRGPMWGPMAPQRASELLALSDAELLAFLREWAPSSSDPFEPSRRGLGREIQNCAAEQPERFGRLAREFRGLVPDYVGHLFRGIHEITKQRTEDPENPTTLPPIDWLSVIELLEWTADQSTSTEKEDAPGNWTWPRRMAVDLAEDAVAATVRTDHSLARRAWAVVRDLMSDPDPTTERDAERGDDPDTFAINTVRGQALHAAIRVAEVLRDAGESGPPGLAPDVLAEIGRRADTAVEPSTAVRCVLGLRFNAIFNIDRDLAGRVASALFPSATDTSDARHAAWRSFLVWNSSAGAVLKLLHEPYALAVARVADADEKLAAELGEHVAWLAVRAAIDIAQPENLLRSFVARAPAAARRHALDDVGRAVYRTDDALGGEVVERLQLFWDWWSVLSVARGDATDLTAFGWWFASKHLDVAWSLAALERTLAATAGRIEWDHAVVAKLAILAPTHAPAVATCLRRMIESPDEWQVIRNAKAIRAALSALVATPEAAAAKQIASRLVARGWPEFQDLSQ